MVLTDGTYFKPKNGNARTIYDVIPSPSVKAEYYAMDASSQSAVMMLTSLLQINGGNKNSDFARLAKRKGKEPESARPKKQMRQGVRKERETAALEEVRNDAGK